MLWQLKFQPPKRISGFSQIFCGINITKYLRIIPHAVTLQKQSTLSIMAAGDASQTTPVQITCVLCRAVLEYI